jgi:predicted amidohydrolase
MKRVHLKRKRIHLTETDTIGSKVLNRMRIQMKPVCNQTFGSLAVVLFVVAISAFIAKDAIGYPSARAEEEKQNSIRIAGVKTVVTNEISVNVEALKQAVDFAEKEKADILLTPEGSLSGYRSDFNRDELDKALTELVDYAASAHVGLALGTCFYEKDGKCYNQIRFYDKMGHFLGFHSKILRCGNLDDPKKGEINEYASAPLRTFLFEGIVIGGLICNDMWANPECTTLPDTHLSQQLSRMGARIIFHAVNGSRDENEWSSVVNWNFHESNLRLKASAGNVWIVTADNAYPENLKSSCPSGVLDPGGNWVCRAEDKGIQYFAYTIELK